MISTHSELIEDLQNKVTKVGDQLKLKTDGDEIDILDQWVHELHERMMELENRAGIQPTEISSKISNA